MPVLSSLKVSGGGGGGGEGEGGEDSFTVDEFHFESVLFVYS